MNSVDSRARTDAHQLRSRSRRVQRRTRPQPCYVRGSPLAGQPPRLGEATPRPACSNRVLTTLASFHGADRRHGMQPPAGDKDRSVGDKDRSLPHAYTCLELFVSAVDGLPAQAATFRSSASAGRATHWLPRLRCSQMAGVELTTTTAAPSASRG